jgi:hypothetical protein
MNNIYNTNLTIAENKMVVSSLQYIKSFIKEMGTFYPFAMLMDKNEIIKSIFPDIEDEFPTSKYLIDLYNETFSKEFANIATNYILSVICIDVFIHEDINGIHIKRNAIEMQFTSREYKKTVQLFYEINTNNEIIFNEWNV